MHIPQKYYKIIRISIVSLLAIIFIVGGLAFAKREALLNAAIKKAISKADSEFDLELKIESAKFVGLSSVQFKNITAVPRGRDSLAKIQNFETDNLDDLNNFEYKAHIESILNRCA